MVLDNKRIVFIGDSITDMNRGRGDWDQNHIYGHSFVFLIASKLKCLSPRRNITVINRGISGNTSRELLERWGEDVIAKEPDIVSILVGVNDVHYNMIGEKPTTVEEYSNNLAEMVRRTHEKLPDSEIVICEPFIHIQSLNDKSHGIGYLEMMPKYREAARTFAEKNGFVFVPLQEEFDTAYEDYPDMGEAYWMWDGIHPTAQGHYLIAEKWLKCVDNI